MLNALLHLLFFSGWLSRLLLCSSNGHNVQPGLVISELEVHRNLLISIEIRILRLLFVKQLDSRLAQVLKCRNQLVLWNLSLLLNFTERE